MWLSKDVKLKGPACTPANAFKKLKQSLVAQNSKSVCDACDFANRVGVLYASLFAMVKCWNCCFIFAISKGVATGY